MGHAEEKPEPVDAYAHQGINPQPGHPLQEYTPERVRALNGVETELKNTGRQQKAVAKGTVIERSEGTRHDDIATDKGNNRVN